MREHSARAVLLFTLILNVAMFVLLSFIDKFFSGLIQQPKAPAKNGKIFSIFPEEPSSTITYEEETSDLTIVAEHPNPLYTSYSLEAAGCIGAALDMLARGKIDKAEKLLEHAMSLAPDHPDVLNRYGEFMESTRKDIISADQLYFRALIISPGHSAAKGNRGRLAALVEEIDLGTLHRLDKKRDTVASIPESNTALRKAKREAYFQHIYHTVGIEGNSMSLSQTRSIVETRMAIGGKSIAEHNEVLGLDAALKYINTTLINRIGQLTIEDVLELHRRVLGFVDPTEGGYFRRTQVFVGDHIPPPPSNILPLMQKFLKWLNSWDALSLHPIRYAALAHYKLVHIHPFSDGNGRTSRLLMNMILMWSGYPPVIILKQDRIRYYEAIKMANRGDIRPFVRFIAESAEQTLDLFLWTTSEYSSTVLALDRVDRVITNN
ncbi:FIC domain protein adenylyltransferase [Rhodnius prolixus]